MFIVPVLVIGIVVKVVDELGIVFEVVVKVIVEGLVVVINVDVSVIVLESMGDIVVIVDSLLV